MLIVNQICMKLGMWGFLKIRNADVIIALMYLVEGITSSYFFTFKVHNNFIIRNKIL